MQWECHTASGDVPAPRQSHSSTYCPALDSVVIFGGMSEGVVFNDVYTLDCRMLKWTRQETRGDEPCARYQHSATIYNNLLVIAGGKERSQRLNDIYVLDLDTWSWSCVGADPSREVEGPPPFAFHSASLDCEGKLHILGGTTEQDVPISYAVLDLHSMSWLPTDDISGPSDCDPPAERHSHSSVIDPDGRHIYMFGGLVNGSVAVNDVRQLEVRSSRWTCLSANNATGAPSARYKHASVMLGDTWLMVIGGYDRKARSDIHVFHLPTSTWYEVPITSASTSGPCLSLEAREGHTATVVGDSRVMVLGGYEFISGCFSLDTVYELDTASWPGDALSHPSPRPGRLASTSSSLAGKTFASSLTSSSSHSASTTVNRSMSSRPGLADETKSVHPFEFDISMITPRSTSTFTSASLLFSPDGMHASLTPRTPDSAAPVLHSTARPSPTAHSLASIAKSTAAMAEFSPVAGVGCVTPNHASVGGPRIPLRKYATGLAGTKMQYPSARKAELISGSQAGHARSMTMSIGDSSIPLTSTIMSRTSSMPSMGRTVAHVADSRVEPRVDVSVAGSRLAWLAPPSAPEKADDPVEVARPLGAKVRCDMVLAAASALRRDIIEKELEVGRTQALQTELIGAVNELMRHQSESDGSRVREEELMKQLETARAAAHEKMTRLAEVQSKREQAAQTLRQLQTSVQRQEAKLLLGRKQTLTLLKTKGDLMARARASGLEPVFDSTSLAPCTLPCTATPEIGQAGALLL